MSAKRSNILVSLVLFAAGAWILSVITSCGKGNNASPTGLNIQYDILNLSPDLGAVDLFIKFNQVNNTASPDRYGVNQGYFYVPYIDTPFQFRPYVLNGTSGTTIFQRNEVLKPGLKYSLFIIGAVRDNTLSQIFTTDTSAIPTIGHGKLRFVNASPTAAGGLDVYANGTQAFNKITYPSSSKYIELPAGNYDLTITNTGTMGILKELPIITIQDGRLYTLYTYGYTTRIDSAAFNAAMITNK
jgi:hypothetical protein